MKNLLFLFMLLLLVILAACDDYNYRYSHPNIYDNQFRNLIVRQVGKTYYIAKLEIKDTTIRQGDAFISATIKRSPITDSFARPSSALTSAEMMATMMYDSCYLESGRYRQRYGSWSSFKTEQRTWVLQTRCHNSKPLKEIRLDFKSKSRIDFDWYLVIALITSLLTPLITVLATRPVKKSDTLSSAFFSAASIFGGGVLAFLILANLGQASEIGILALKTAAAAFFSFCFVLVSVISGAKHIIYRNQAEWEGRGKEPTTVVEFNTGLYLAFAVYYAMFRITGAVWGWWFVICLLLYVFSLWASVLIFKSRLPIKTV